MTLKEIMGTSPILTKSCTRGDLSGTDVTITLNKQGNVNGEPRYSAAIYLRGKALKNLLKYKYISLRAVKGSTRVYFTEEDANMGYKISTANNENGTSARVKLTLVTKESEDFFKKIIGDYNIYKDSQCNLFYIDYSEKNKR